ncbi:MAG: hypothetical protein WCB15_35350 [Desulfobacterales bacterium]
MTSEVNEFFDAIIIVSLNSAKLKIKGTWSICKQSLVKFGDLQLHHTCHRMQHYLITKNIKNTGGIPLRSASAMPSNNSGIVRNKRTAKKALLFTLPSNY